MKQIKNYFKNWDSARIIRVVLAVSLGIAYYFNRETLFIFAAVVLSIQAIFNLSCPGGSCGTNYSKTEKPTIKIDKYEPK
jgi:hypothetical protein